MTVDCETEGKRSFPSHASAMRCARIWVKKDRSALRVYRCQHCGGWHITSVPKLQNLRLEKFHQAKRGWRE